MALLIVTFGCLAAGLVARGEPAGADARAYWAAVRIWLGGGDPYRPTGPFLPYVYAPWMLPLFAPWALMPWDVAWYVWRGGTILLLLWTIHWAYSRRPLATAITVALLGFPFGANLDTGNINLLLTLLLWGAQFSGPRTAGALWAIAAWMKWVPVVFLVVLSPRARLWGLLFLAVSVLLSLATLPGTISQLEALVSFGRRPIRLDYIVFLWALVPVLWRRAGAVRLAASGVVARPDRDAPRRAPVADPAGPRLGRAAPRLTRRPSRPPTDAVASSPDRGQAASGCGDGLPGRAAVGPARRPAGGRASRSAK